MLPDFLGALSSNLCQLSALQLKEAIGHVYANTIFLKWGIFNVIMTLVAIVPFLNNIFMVLLISALAKNGVTKPIAIFLDSCSPKGGGGSCVCACMGGHVIIG